MKICVAQTRPFKGDVEKNIESHIKLIALAVSGGAEIIVFPELSLTGYEPTLAKHLATDKNDTRFNDFQKISDEGLLTIGTGIPVKTEKGICITMVLFQPGRPRETYSKKFLHSDEEAFFVAGQSSINAIGKKANISLAICYELSIAEHSQNAHKSGAEFYIASVAKTANGIEKAIKSLADISRMYSMTVLMANCIGECDGEECGGKTSVWNNTGVLLAQLDDSNEGLIIIDTDTQEITEKIV